MDEVVGLLIIVVVVIVVVVLYCNIKMEKFYFGKVYYASTRGKLRKILYFALC